jgi:hypothetical protein
MAKTQGSAAVDELEALDSALVASAFVPISPWWLDTLRRFLLSGRRQLVVRAGRRGGKSSSLCRFAVSFALAYDLKQIPKGDVGTVAFFSTRQDEAAQRLRTIKAILDALGLKHRPIESGIELVGRPIVFKVFPASVVGASGFTGILVVCDEVSKWRDSDTGANPSTEVLAAVRPTMATQPDARIVLSSSPLTHEDSHAKAFDAGDNAHQVVAYAPTWIANPTITEQQTRDDEPDPRVWAREYAAIPQAAKSGAFDVAVVERAFAHPRPRDGYTPGKCHVIIDPSSGGRDAFTIGVVRWMTPKQERPAARSYLRLEYISTLGSGSFWADGDANALADQIARVAREWGATDVHSDQRESFTWRTLIRDRKLDFHEHTYTSASKPKALERLRRWLAEERISLCLSDKLRSELFAFEETISPTGQPTFKGRGTSHDDHVAILITAALAELSGDISSDELEVAFTIGPGDGRGTMRRAA